LKEWIERVFTLGFASGLTPDGCRGDIRGRLPRLTHKKALINNTTIFDDQSYKSELAPAMKTSIHDYALRYPGAQQVEHVYFYAVHGAEEATRRSYLDKAYSLGRSF
jgi:NAD(P)H dehydrogenase (quinone)